MSGGTLTDYNYDLHRLTEWASRMKHAVDDNESEWSDEFRLETVWLCGLLYDLEKVLHDIDYTISGDSAEERALTAVCGFRDKWTCAGRTTPADIQIALGYMENARRYLERYGTISERRD